MTALIPQAPIVELGSSGLPATTDQAPQGDDAQAQTELDRILQEKEEVSSELRSIMEDIQGMFAAMSENNADIQRDIDDILNKIREARTEVEKATKANYDPNHVHEEDDLDKEFAHYEYSASHDEEYADSEDEADTILNANKTESPELVKLFRKIANKTHPDKTDDPALHSMFVTAKEYRKRGDIEGLREIWGYLNGRGSNLISKLMKRLEEELANLRMLRIQLATLRHSDDYTLLRFFKTETKRVLEASRTQAVLKRDRLLAHLEMLNSLLGKKPEVHNIFDTAFE